MEKNMETTIGEFELHIAWSQEIEAWVLWIWGVKGFSFDGQVPEVNLKSNIRRPFLELLNPAAGNTHDATLKTRSCKS